MTTMARLYFGLVGLLVGFVFGSGVGIAAFGGAVNGGLTIGIVFAVIFALLAVPVMDTLARIFGSDPQKREGETAPKEIVLSITEAQDRFEEILGLAITGVRVLIRSEQGRLAELRPFHDKGRPNA